MVIGTTAGSYRIIDVVSVGGMGTVYRAEHTLIGRFAAVKVLHPEFSANEEIVQRFFNEAKATTSVRHPGIVEIFDFGYLDSGHAYLVMEFLDGRTLAARNKQRGPVDDAEAAALLRGVCSALAAAHAKGIVHRDLKPENIFLVPDAESQLGERPKILDFGIAKLTDIGLAGTATKTGAVMGTPTYMSPEQCKGVGEVDHRADLYSIGCVFYEMVTGRPPFIERGTGELIAVHLFVQPDPPSKHGAQISPEGEALVMALLAKNPAERPQTAVELAHLLSGIAVGGGFGPSTSWDRPSLHSIERGSMPLIDGVPAYATPPPSTPSPRDGRASSQRLDGRASSEPVASRASSQHLPRTPYPVTTLGHGPSSPRVTPVAGTAAFAEKPTTLSGAASQTTGASRGSKKWIALAAAFIAAGAAVAIVLASSDPSSPQPATAPSVATPGPTAEPAAGPISPTPPAPTVATPQPSSPAATVQPPATVEAPQPTAPQPATDDSGAKLSSQTGATKPSESNQTNKRVTNRAKQTRQTKQTKRNPTIETTNQTKTPTTGDTLLETDL